MGGDLKLTKVRFGGVLGGDVFSSKYQRNINEISEEVALNAYSRHLC
jgi:hypothetical protein